MTDLLALADRVEAATGPARELDIAIWALVGWTEGSDFSHAWKLQLPIGPAELIVGRTLREAFEQYPGDVNGVARNWNVPRLTSSLDAAMTLVPEGCWADGGQGETRPWACVTRRADLMDFASNAATPALALTAACLRARAAGDPA